jgi:hypothetical protein
MAKTEGGKKIVHVAPHVKRKKGRVNKTLHIPEHYRSTPNK